MKQSGFLEFETRNNKYIFNGTTGEIKVLDPDNEEEFYQDEPCEVETDIDIKEQMFQTASMSLILVLTGKCNLRCEYCVYNDKYPKEISYDNGNMSIETARKALDQFFNLYKKRLERGFFKKPSILLYGGEPLIKFDLIKEIVDYVHEKKYDCEFYMTTNAVLLTKEKAEFLARNNFRITFSLDGYKYNHDRNRVTINNQPTFDIIIKNIKNYVVEKNKIDKDHMISFNCCYDDYTDIEQCVDFFTENAELFFPMYVLYSYISPYDTTYYTWLENKMKEEGRQKCFNESYKRVRDRFIAGEYKTKTELAAVENLLLGAYSLAVRNKNKIHALNNCCIPLSKLAVYPDGTYTICEKMNKRLPIGNVDTGINYEEIQRVTDKMVESLNSGKCATCPVKRLCSACFQFMDENEKINKGFCERQKKSIKSMLIDYCDMRERNPTIIDKFVSDEEEFNYLNVLK